MVIGLILASAALLTIDSRLRSSLVAYAVFTAATLWLAFPHPSSPAEIAFVATLVTLKLLVGPAALIALVRRYDVSNDLAPSLGLPWRLLIVVVTLIVAHEIGKLSAVSDLPATGVVFYAVLASVTIVVLHRNLLAHVIGLLMLGSAITLAGAVFAPELPLAIELAMTFDAVIATLLALAIARALLAFDPKLDIRSLRELRG
jgi:hydrogenase-4 membrane subunit HyfE